MDSTAESSPSSRFMRLYDSLGPGRLQGLGAVYHPEVEFLDPFHEIRGLTSLVAYFETLYGGVESCTFDWGHAVDHGNLSFVEWRMRLVHRTFRPGVPVEVPGCTRLVWKDGLVREHRDHFDAGALIYERIPLLGTIVTAIRRRVGS